MESALRTHNLTKCFKGTYAVNDLNINLEKGDIYGFIGKNGAGKTTTIRLILNLLKPTEGYVELFGEKVTNANIHQFLKRIGSIIEIPGFYLNLSGEENLDIHRVMMGVNDKTENDRVLKIVGLREEKSKKVKYYSLGMKQRLGIARALLHNPDLLILDEPTNGLDPKGIVEIRDLILEISKKHGKTIFVSSHILTEIEKMVNRVGIIHKGKLLEEITQDQLQKKYQKHAVFKVSDLQKSIELLNKNLDISDIEVQGDGFSIKVIDDTMNGIITNLLVQNNIFVKESKTVTPSLEDYFIKLTEGESA